MTEDHQRPAKKQAPALASRILAVGASAAATIGLVGAMVARSPSPSTATKPAAVVASPVVRDLHIVVVIKRPQSAAPVSVSRPPSATRAPRIIQRYVTAPAVTTTHAS